MRRKALRRLPSQQAHLLALVLGADQRTGGGQAAHAVAVGVGQLQGISRHHRGNGLVLFQGDHRHALTVAGGLGGDLRRAHQQHPTGTGADGKLGLLRLVKHHGKRFLIAVRLQQLAAVLLGGVGTEGDLCALTAGKEEQHKAAVIAGNDHAQHVFALVHAQPSRNEDAHLGYLAVLQLCQTYLVHLLLVGEEQCLHVVAGLQLLDDLVPLLQLVRTGEIEQLEKDIADLNDVLAKPARIRRIIINELNDVAKKYGKPRCSEILYDLPEEESGAEEESIPDYPVTVFFTREGYLKKIPPQSLRTAGAHKLKEGDEIIHQVETRNNVEALFFTDKQQVYKVRLNELEDGKVAQMGIYLPGRLGMDEGENILAMVITGDYSGYVLFFFAGGKCAKIPLASYATKQNRRKLLKAYSDKEPLAKLLFLPEDTELAIRTSAGRMLLVNTAQIAAKTTRDSQGVAVVTLKKNQTIASVVPAETLELANPHRYRVRSLPATGALIRAEDEGEQLTML